MGFVETVVRLTTEEAVAAGGVFLDEKHPDWRDRVAPDKLDMSDPESCILTQASDMPFGSAITFHNLGLLNTFGAINLGFDLPGGNTTEWENLTNEWLSQYFSKT